MAIRDRFSRLVRRSASSSGSSGGCSDDSQGDQPSAAAPTAPLAKSTSRLAKITSWRSRRRNKRKLSSSTSPHKRFGGGPSTSAAAAATTADEPHPSERPLTEQNLQHQEMLRTFTLKFGQGAGRRFSRGGLSSLSGVSPGNSRPGSVDHGVARGGAAAVGDAGPYGPMRMDSLVATGEDRIAEEGL